MWQDWAMSLPVLGKQKGLRDKCVALRLTKETVSQLKKIAEGHNLSQADVVSLLVEQEFEKFVKRQVKSK